jgi:hypothetical protein
LKTLKKITLPLLLAVLLVTCKKDHNVLGVDVQPSDDALNAEYVDAIPVTGHTIRYDSIPSFGDRNKYIGSNNDPYFGRADIGLYLNATMSVTSFDFGAGAILSSAEIILAVNIPASAGDVNTSLTYSVYPLDRALTPSTIYYTSNNRLHSSTPLPTFSTKTYTIMNGKQVLRIPVDAAYANALLHDTPSLTSNEAFQAKYKGFYITTSLGSGSEGVIYKVDLEDDISGFYLHYRKDNTSTDTTDFKFIFSGSTAVKYNTVAYNPSTAIASQLQDTTLGGQNLFLKGMGLTRLKIQIPFLKNYSDSVTVAVNRAELILYADPSISGTGYYVVPPSLTLLAMDSLGREIFIKDESNATDFVRYDGNYNSEKKGYVFNIAREAQLIFRGQKKNYGFYVVVAGTNPALKAVYNGNSKDLLPLRRDNYVERVVLAGSGQLSLRPRLNLSYIKLKNDH